MIEPGSTTILPWYRSLTQTRARCVFAVPATNIDNGSHAGSLQVDGRTVNESSYIVTITFQDVEGDKCQAYV